MKPQEMLATRNKCADNEIFLARNEVYIYIYERIKVPIMKFTPQEMMSAR